MYSELEKVLKTSIEYSELKQKDEFEEYVLQFDFSWYDVLQRLEYTKFEHAFLSGDTNAIKENEYAYHTPSKWLDPIVVMKDQHSEGLTIYRLLEEKPDEYLDWQKWRLNSIRTDEYTREIFPKFTEAFSSNPIGTTAHVFSNTLGNPGDIIPVNFIKKDGTIAKEDLICQHSVKQKGDFPFMYVSQMYVPDEAFERETSFNPVLS